MAHKVCPDWTTWISAPSAFGVETRNGEKATVVVEAALEAPDPPAAGAEVFPADPLPEAEPTTNV